MKCLTICTNCKKGVALHDIGKILVPLNLTSSPRTFTQNERSIMEMHTLIGAEMLKEDFSQTVVDVCLYHHEQPNGDGYTDKLCLKDIPEGALIVKVADEYDALVSKRIMEERDGKQYYADASGSVDERPSDERKAERDESFYAEEDLPRNNPYLNRTVDLSDRVTYDKHTEEEAEDRFLY